MAADRGGLIIMNDPGQQVRGHVIGQCRVASAPARGLPLHWLGVLPFAVRAAVPDPADDEHRHRRVPDPATGSFTLENIYQLNTPRSGAYLDLDQDQRRLGAAGLPDRLCHGGGDGAGRAAQGDPRAAADLFGRGLELRRRAAGLRLSSPRSGLGLVTVLAAHAASASICAAWGFNLLSFLGPDADLPVLPDPADDPDHHPGARRAEARMARGGSILGDSGRNTGAWSPCRSCSRRCWARFALLFANAFGAVATAYCADRARRSTSCRSCCSRRSGATFWATRTSAMRWPSA
jgi:hypothetical protein